MIFAWEHFEILLVVFRPKTQGHSGITYSMWHHNLLFYPAQSVLSQKSYLQFEIIYIDKMCHPNSRPVANVDFGKIR